MNGQVGNCKRRSENNVSSTMVLIPTYPKVEAWPVAASQLKKGDRCKDVNSADRRLICRCRRQQEERKCIGREPDSLYTRTN